MEEFFKYGDKYIEEVIRPLLPNANLGGFIMNNFYLYNTGQLVDSIYERKITEDTYFLHFTNISSLLEIIRSKIIRMSDFNCFRDQFELTISNNNLVDYKQDFVELKSCLFALSLCEDSKENLNNSYMWEHYGDCNKGVCIRLKLVKEKSFIPNFYLGRINYIPNNQIIELEQLKERHMNFKNNYGKAIDNLEDILLSACAMYKKSDPFRNENEIRLLAYIRKPDDYHHTNCDYPIRHKYNSKQDMIEYFLELKLENEIDSNSLNYKYNLPYLSIDSVILGNKCFGNNISKIMNVLQYEFFDSFNRDLHFFRI